MKEGKEPGGQEEAAAVSGVRLKGWGSETPTQASPQEEELSQCPRTPGQVQTDKKHFVYCQRFDVLYQVLSQYLLT